MQSQFKTQNARIIVIIKVKYRILVNLCRKNDLITKNSDVNLYQNIFVSKIRASDFKLIKKIVGKTKISFLHINKIRVFKRDI